ncbi:MAG: ergothioneine biosynthesis protein EgtC [Actinomycetota bacterium]|nr:ergothioneine biosynthesis protein EgtC [Actinomycetota bacterium]
MCRHTAWLGAPRSVASLVLAPEHGLLTQSYAPRRQAHGRVNADGWGVGLLPGEGRPLVRWRSTRPLWQDASFASVSPLLCAGAILAAVRSATPGMPIEEGATAPFTDGRWLLSHNGRVDRGILPTEAPAESVCDSAVLAAYVLNRGADTLGTTVVAVAADDPAARLNLLATDGTQILATAWGDTLSYLLTPDGIVVASEPHDDDPRWVDVPDRHLLDARWPQASVTLTSLERP